jgi:glycosyltransferase involved in cell wall biosynthesis
VKLACVVHRYGAEIAGGSEAHCRHLAERLSARHEVTVLTTCAKDYVTWANAYPPGRSRINQVDVHRFPVRRPRRLKVFADISDEVFDARASTGRQEEWFRENGPDSPALLDHLRAHGREYDLVLFWSYRYYTAYFGLPLVADRSVLVPTAEEDPAIGLDVLEDYFKKPAGFLFLTPEEQELVSRRAGQRLEPAAVVGSGLDEPGSAIPHSGSQRAALIGIGVPQDFLLYLGRVDHNKGCSTLFEYFQQHLADGGRETTLVLAGPAKMLVPQHARIRALGFVDDSVRDALLAEARALVVPSPYESLSIALLEGWNHVVPALVNGDCAVLQGQVRRANGGLYYRSAKEFSAGLDWLLAHRREGRVLGQQGRAYVDREYRWPIVMERVEALLEAVGRLKPSPARAPETPTRAPRG